VDLRTYLVCHCLCDVCRPRQWAQQRCRQEPSTLTWYIPGYDNDIVSDSVTTTITPTEEEASDNDGNGWRVTARPLECSKVASHYECDISTYMSVDQARAYHKLTDYYKPV